VKKYKVSIDGKTFEVDLSRLDDDIAHVNVEGRLYEVHVEPPESEPAVTRITRTQAPAPAVSAPPAASAPPAPTGAGPRSVILAPIPGLILEVLVKPGDRVKARQTVVRMETMKMENEIQSSRDGTVKEVRVRQGMEVNQGQVLVILEEPKND